MGQQFNPLVNGCVIDCTTRAQWGKAHSENDSKRKKINGEKLQYRAVHRLLFTKRFAPGAMGSALFPLRLIFSDVLLWEVHYD